PPAFQAWEPVRLSVPGIVSLPWAVGTLTASLVKRQGKETSDSAPVDLLPLPPHEALLDIITLSEPLVARPPRPGDRIQPLGMTGHRRLQDLLTDRKVQVRERRCLPVVCDAEKIVWVAGHCVSERVKVTEATTAAVRLVWNQK